MENNQSTMEKFEIVKCGPYRFVGKSVYARAGQSDDFCITAMKSDWVFEALDNLSEYATDDIYDAALVTWDKYDDKNQLMCYTAGRFMKADTPVPENMDYIDIPEGYVAKCFARGGDAMSNSLQMLKGKVEQQGYQAATWEWSAEIFPNRHDVLNNVPNHVMGAYSALR